MGPPPILIIVSFIGEICGTFDKLSVDRCLGFKSFFFSTFFIAILKIKKCLQDSQYTLFSFVSYY